MLSVLLEEERKRQKRKSVSQPANKSTEWVNSPRTGEEKDYCSSRDVEQGEWDSTVSREILHVSVRVKNKTVRCTNFSLLCV